MNVTCPFLTAVRVAELCGVHPATVHRWARRGTLRPVIYNGVRRFSPEAVLALCLDRSLRGGPAA